MDPRPTREIQLNERVFTTRTLNLNSTRVIGFDMDYTLVLYKERAVEELAFQLAAEHLVERMGYPEQVRQLSFTPDGVIRGLVIDKRLGNLVKINRFGYVKAALHGDHFFSREELRETYSNVIVSFAEDRYEMIHTMFSLALSSLLCQIIALDRVDKPYGEIYADVQSVINDLHRMGPLKDRILESPDRYIHRDPRYAETLMMFRRFGKTLLLITNSGWTYTKGIMSWCYDAFLPEGQSWRDLFDLIIVDAVKPDFFYAGNPYYEVVTEEGHLIKNQDTLERGRIYQGGNAVAIESLFDVGRGQILYIGDHIYSDVYHSKKICHWRTMLVITELERELNAALEAEPHLERIKEWMRRKEALELDLDEAKKRQAAAGRAHRSDRPPVLDEREARVREQIKAIDDQVGPLIEAYDAHFNPHWGELLYAGNDKTYFFTAVERYACTYTSRVSNLLNYSPAHYFRPPMKSYRAH